MFAPAAAQDRATIDKLNHDYADAFNKGDFAAVALLYAEDAYLLPPGSPLIKGRSSIQAYMAQAVKGGGDFKMVTGDLKPLGPDSAREVGTFSFVMKGPQSQQVMGKYVIVWQKIGNDWKLSTDIWNTDK
jgi:uncharacterized protein (TIGR02246 family)